MVAENVRALWTGDNLHLAIGESVLLDGAFFSIREGERVAMVGRNGCGKSTLLRIIAGEEHPDSGEITRARNLRVSFMPQDFNFVSDKNVRDVVREGLSYFERILHDYETLPVNSGEREQAAAFLDIHDGWNLENKLDSVLNRLCLDGSLGERSFTRLSGGERRRVLLARAVIGEPELLLLDEPTNHLDIVTVGQIEAFLEEYRGACLIVTHDRFFLDRTADRIVELDHGKTYSVQGSYADFLEYKAEREYNEDVLEQKRRAFLRREIEWVRRSPKARLRRNLGRERRYYEIAAQTGPERTDDMELVIPPPPRLGNKVVELHNIRLVLNDKPILEDFSAEFAAGDKVGIVGANGAGKSSLLNVITGKLGVNSGTVEVADTVVFNYIDQNRGLLDPEKTVLEEVGDGKEFIQFGHERLTVWTYLKRFLFTDERIKTRVKYLSGGEKARLALAKELKRGGNFLILDEPTNDLDLPTLRVLEEALANFPSTVLVVSHDRYFLNRVCNHILAFDEPGYPSMDVGDFDYYYSRKTANMQAQNAQKASSVPVKSAQPDKNTVRKTTRKKLSYTEERELSILEESIPELEEEISAIEKKFSDPSAFSDPVREMKEWNEKLTVLKQQLEEKYSRWEFLAEKKEQLENS